MRARLMAAVAVVLSAGGCHGCEPSAIGHQAYELVFDEQFDTFDTSVWATHQPWYGEPPAGSVVVENGILTLSSRASDGHPSVEVPSLGPRTGTSYPFYPQARTFQEGYFEVRMRYTHSPHSRPAFWMLGAERAQRFPDLACPTLQGEWNIMENFYSPAADQFHAAQHRNTGGLCGVPHELTNFTALVDFDLSDWHIYGGRWADGQLCASIDNVAVGCMTAYDTLAQPMYLILSQGANCPSWVGTACNKPVPDEIVTQFDWVRVWQRPSG